MVAFDNLSLKIIIMMMMMMMMVVMVTETRMMGLLSGKSLMICSAVLIDTVDEFVG